MKLVIVVGTRPEIIRLAPTIKKARESFDTILVHTGQNYDPNLNDIFFRDLELALPDYYLDCSRENLGAAVGDIITKSYNLFLKLNPDALLILGDTNSCLCAYSAKRLKIPIFHMEAGNRCFDPNVPEEINRKVIDHLADVNICYTEHARRNLLQEGIKTQYTFVVGSPMREVIYSVLDKIISSSILEKMDLTPKEYFVISFHREENVCTKKSFMNIIDCINNIVDTYNKKIVVSVHPRTRKMLVEKNIVFDERVILCEPFGLLDYCKLQMNALCVIADSGTTTEEASILQFPAVLLRNSTERPEGIDAGNIIMGDINWPNLQTNLKIAIQKDKWNDITYYDDVNISQKVCDIISGYTGIVNKFLWMK